MFIRDAKILDREDDDIATEAESILAGEGIEMVTSTHVTEVRDGESGATVLYDKDGRQHSIEVDAILPATGRVPATRGLGLDAAGVRTTDKGVIEVDEHLRTSQPHIYAAGDVKGEAVFTTYLSLDDGRIILDQLTGEGRRSTTDRVVVPRTLFMTPRWRPWG
jgi:probable pyridine nucleotide-disulfide oxidoreductase